MRHYLNQEQIQDARRLYSQGLPKPAISRAFRALFAVHRTTVYRHLNNDQTKYVNVRKAPKERPPVFYRIQSLKHEYDLTSAEIAERLGMDLRAVNKLWV